MPRLTVRHDTFPLAGTFRISRGARTEIHVVVVELEEDGVVGRGECVPYARYGESIDSVIEQIRSVTDEIESGWDCAALNASFPAGAARNALDCALWDLAAKQNDTTVWALAGLPAPKPAVTAFTLSLDTPEAMAENARNNAGRPLFKLKLTGDGDMPRVAAVRDAAPDARLIVDANEGWTADMVEPYSAQLAEYGVEMIEQPLPAAEDGLLADVAHPVPLCADESAHDRAGFQKLVGKYEMINIKLDKTGGLTEALALKAMAEDAGMKIMIGCMLATSLGMAPAFMAAQGAQVVDLDGPLLLARDRDPGFTFHGSIMMPPPRALWG